MRTTTPGRITAGIPALAGFLDSADSQVDLSLPSALMGELGRLRIDFNVWLNDHYR